MKKKVLRRQIADLNVRNGVLVRAAETWQEEARAWRARYEEAVSSPEIKADTEAAFTRGADHMKQSVAAFLYDFILKLETPRES